MATLPDSAKSWLEQKVFATIATVDPDGRPQLSVVWAGHDGDDIVMSTVRGRKKARNLERDQRATVLLTNPENPYQYAEVRGTVTLVDEGARDQIDAFAKEYMGKDRYDMDGPDDVRVTIRLTPEHVTGM